MAILKTARRFAPRNNRSAEEELVRRTKLLENELIRELQRQFSQLVQAQSRDLFGSVAGQITNLTIPGVKRGTGQVQGLLVDIFRRAIRYR